MTVTQLLRALQFVPGDLEVVLQATNYDDGRVAVDAARAVAIEDRGDGPKFYIQGARE